MTLVRIGNKNGRAVGFAFIIMKNFRISFLNSMVTETNIHLSLAFCTQLKGNSNRHVWNFKKVEYLTKTNKGDVTVNWYYEEDDEDMLEAGEDYDFIINIPFNFVSVEELWLKRY